MANPRFAWGIDIGNRALKAVKVVRDGDALRVDDFEFIEHETVLSQAGDNRESLIQTALASFVQRHSFKGGVVSAGVSGQSSFARFVKLPPVEDKKIPEIVRFEAIQQIPFPLDDVEWSYQLFRQQDNPEVEVGIFAMRRELVNQHIKYFTDFDLNVQTVQMNPLAVYNALQYDGRFNDGVAMVVDVGTDNTDLLIASNDSIWMRSIPIGGSNFTEALTKAFKLNFVKAEDLKRNAATSKYARQIFQHMRPVFADLVAEIQRSIGFYASVHRDQKINKIFALGGTFKLPGLQKYLQQNLQLPVERIDSLAAGAPVDPKQAAMFGDNLLSIVGAYGLALQAMGGATVNSSLLPRAIQRERMWQDKTKWFGLAAALFVGGATVVGARWFLESMQWDNNQQVRSQNERVLQQASTLSGKWSTLQNSGETERTVIGNVQRLTDGKYFWHDLLGEITAALPTPQDELRDAIRSGNADAIKKVPRDQRRIIRIDEVTSTYNPKLIADLALPNYKLGEGITPGSNNSGMSDFNGGMPGMPGQDPAVPGVDPAGKGRGFVMLIRFTCPLANAPQFVEQDVQQALMTIAPSAQRPNLKYAVRKWRYVSGNRIAENQSRLTRLQAEYDAAQRAKMGNVTPGQNPTIAPPSFRPGGFGGPRPGGFDPEFPNGFDDGTPRGGFGGGFGGGAPAVPATRGDEPAFKDRITGESVLADWEFTIAVAVELDPEAYVPPVKNPDESVSSAAQ